MMVKCWPFLFYCLAFIVQFHLITCEGGRISISWSLANLRPRNWWPIAHNQVGPTLNEENMENGPGTSNTIASQQSTLYNAYERPVRGVNLLNLLAKNSGGATVIRNRHNVDIVDDRPIWGDSTDQVYDTDDKTKNSRLLITNMNTGFTPISRNSEPDDRPVWGVDTQYDNVQSESSTQNTNNDKVASDHQTSNEEEEDQIVNPGKDNPQNSNADASVHQNSNEEDIVTQSINSDKVIPQNKSDKKNTVNQNNSEDRESIVIPNTHEDKNAPQNTSDEKDTGNQNSSENKNNSNDQHNNWNRDISVTEGTETEEDTIVQTTSDTGERDTINNSRSTTDGSPPNSADEKDFIENINDKTGPNSTEYPSYEGSTETEVVTSIDFKPVAKPRTFPTTQPNAEELPAKLSDEITTDEKDLQDEPADERERFLPFVDFLPNKSLKYCRIHCKFPSAVPYVSGGIDAQLHEFPHMATLGYGSDEVRGRFSSWNTCGATLISKNFVLTAAHCTDSSWGPPTVVRIGEHDLSRQYEGADPKDYKVIKVIVHPDYVVDHSSLYNDIALLQLAKSVKFTKHLRPACLHNGVFLDEQQPRELKNAVATGWGNTGFVDAPSDVLQKVTLDLISNEECKKYVNPGPYIPSGIIESQMCAGILTGGKDTCVGDSGGPLQVNNTVFHPDRVCPMEIIGITSFGKFCGQAKSPGVYTKVAPFVPWIESIVWPTL